MHPDKQRRKFARMKVSLPCQYKLQSDEEGKWEQGMLFSIGTGGVGIETRFSLYPKERVEVRFNLAGKSISALVEIVYVIGRKAGAKFLAISEKDVEAIQAYIHKNLLKESGF